MHYRLVPVLLLLFATAFAACDFVDGLNEPARLRVLLTDAPGDIEKAVVTIDSVYLQADDGEDGAGRIVLRDEPATVDLLTLQNEVLDLIEDEAVPAGTYSQLRLVISGGYIEVKEGDSFAIYASSDEYAAANEVEATSELQMPSFAQSGLKIVLPAEAAVIEGDQNVILLDFNVAESFGKQAGQSGSWVMSPVIRATELSLTGGAEISLSLDEGVTLPDGVTLADFSATVAKGEESVEVDFTDPDGSGTFAVLFQYLVPGTYPVDVTVPEGLSITTDVQLPLEVVVDSGATAQAAVVITEVTEE